MTFGMRSEFPLVAPMDDGFNELVGALESAGCTMRGRSVVCAFHGDRTASGSIYQGQDGRWRYRCHACSAAGDAADIIALHTGKPLDDVLRNLREQEGHPVRTVNPNKPEPRIWPTLDALVESFGQKVVDVYRYQDPQTEAVELAVIRLRGKSFLQVSPAPGGGWWCKGLPGTQPIYGRERISTAELVVVVEGEKDANALADLGIIATTSPMGADGAEVPLENDGKPGRADWSPLAGKLVVLWGDDDEPGRRHMQRVARILGRLHPRPRLRIIDRGMLGGAKDAADFIVDNGQVTEDAARTAVHRLIESARPIHAAAPLHARIEAAIGGKLVAVPWPWASVGALSQALMPGAISLLVGAPGASKSFMALQAVLWWLNEGWRVALYELEEDQGFWLNRGLALLEERSSLTDPAWIAAHADETRAALARHQAALDRLAGCLTTAPAEAPTLEDLAVWIEGQAKAGARIIVADPLTAASEGTDRPWVAARKFMMRAKAAARSAGASIVLTSHGRRGDGRVKGPPDLDSLAGGAAFARFASVVLWLEALAEPAMAQVVDPDRRERAAEINRRLRVLKAREGRGTGLTVGMQFDGRTLRTSEVGVVVTNAIQARRAGSSAAGRSGRDFAAGDARREDEP